MEAYFIHVEKGQHLEHPLYIYHITDARSVNIFSQPRSLMIVDEHGSGSDCRKLCYAGIKRKFYKPGHGDHC